MSVLSTYHLKGARNNTVHVPATLRYTYIFLRVMCSTTGHHYTTRVSLWVGVEHAVVTVSLSDVYHVLYLPLGFPVPFSSSGQIRPTLCGAGNSLNF